MQVVERAACVPCGVRELPDGVEQGGVERQIELTWSAVTGSAQSAHGSSCSPRISAQVLLFQERGSWADRIEAMGMQVWLFPVYNASGLLQPDSDVHVDALVQKLRGFDLAHVWYGGGALGSFSTFASLVAARARVPVVQNLAWNVFSVDLNVAVVVIECDETQDLHRANLQDKYRVSPQDLVQAWSSCTRGRSAGELSRRTFAGARERAPVTCHVTTCPPDVCVCVCVCMHARTCVGRQEQLGIANPEHQQQILEQGFTLLPAQEARWQLEEEDPEERAWEDGAMSVDGDVLLELSRALAVS